jgi:mono/diheme cytochrome c family protein
VRRISLVVVTLAAAAVVATVPLGAAESPHVSAATPIEAGRFLVRYGGCNDCHTPGYAEAGGTLPEAEWLTGNPVGFKGPWGTTFASNLRLTVAGMPADAWVGMLHTRNGAPPMPWPSVHALTDDDARALYAYIKSLGVKGQRTPADLPPKS